MFRHDMAKRKPQTVDVFPQEIKIARPPEICDATGDVALIIYVMPGIVGCKECLDIKWISRVLVSETNP